MRMNTEKHFNKSYLSIIVCCVLYCNNLYANNNHADPYQGLKFYYGDNHFHSGFSGDNTDDDYPLMAFINAAQRVQKEGADATLGGDPTDDLGGYFLFMSDHVQFIPTRKDMTNSMYQVMRKEADDSRADLKGPHYTFTVFSGGELTGLARDFLGAMPWDDKFGHLNIFNLKDISNFTENELAWNIKGTVVMDRLTKEEDAIGQFNHPGYNNEPRTGNDSSSLYPYTPARDRVFKFFEVTDGHPNNWEIGAAQYNLCLRHGYHISPVVGSDIHNTKFPLLFKPLSPFKSARTVILAPSTINMPISERRTVLLESIRKGLVYVSEDSNLQIKASMNGHPIGHQFTTMPEVLEVKIDIKDPSPPEIDKLQSIELLQNKDCTDGKKLLEDKDVTSESQCTKVIKRWTVNESKSEFSSDLTQFHTTLQINTKDLGKLNYIYLKVVEQDGDRAMTTPFFFK
ncbi:MAG: CehA/McbA family metallohydrolase domain-containing protein [Gammaproteobacteria bacterium]